MKKERCPDYCPFLKKEAFYCQLFGKHLIFDEFIVKCEECMNADVRKSQYKKKVKDFERRQKLWDKALKQRPSKIWQQIKVTFKNWKEMKGLKEFLSEIAKEFPILLDKKTSKLLMNLFLSLSNSEKEQMKALLVNPKTAEILIKFIQKTDVDKDILKKVRGEMDRITLQEKKTKEYMFERIRNEKQKVIEMSR